LVACLASSAAARLVSGVAENGASREAARSSVPGSSAPMSRRSGWTKSSSARPSRRFSGACASCRRRPSASSRSSQRSHVPTGTCELTSRNAPSAAQAAKAAMAASRRGSSCAPASPTSVSNAKCTTGAAAIRLWPLRRQQGDRAGDPSAAPLRSPAPQLRRGRKRYRHATPCPDPARRHASQRSSRRRQRRCQDGRYRGQQLCPGGSPSSDSSGGLHPHARRQVDLLARRAQ